MFLEPFYQGSIDEWAGLRSTRTCAMLLAATETSSAPCPEPGGTRLGPAPSCAEKVSLQKGQAGVPQGWTLPCPEGLPLEWVGSTFGARKALRVLVQGQKTALVDCGTLDIPKGQGVWEDRFLDAKCVGPSINPWGGPWRRSNPSNRLRPGVPLGGRAFKHRFAAVSACGRSRIYMAELRKEGCPLGWIHHVYVHVHGT